MRPDYFKCVANSLLSLKADTKVSLNFILLKSYEYWIRVIRYSKCYPDADENRQHEGGILPENPGQDCRRRAGGIHENRDVPHIAQASLPATALLCHEGPADHGKQRDDCRCVRSPARSEEADERCRTEAPRRAVLRGILQSAPAKYGPEFGKVWRRAAENG